MISTKSSCLVCGGLHSEKGPSLPLTLRLMGPYELLLASGSDASGTGSSAATGGGGEATASGPSEGGSGSGGTETAVMGARLAESSCNCCALQIPGEWSLPMDTTEKLSQHTGYLVSYSSL